jgi:translation initiation factor 3 subunit B
VDFRTIDEANFALVAMNGHPFDARHQFAVYRFTDIERYESLDDSYVPPTPEVYRPRARFLLLFASGYHSDSFE